MPLYEYECPSGHVTERLRRVTEREDGIGCHYCGHPALPIITAPAPVAPDLTPYFDNGLGRHVESRSHRRRLMQEASVEERGTSRMHGARGTIFSFPGQTATSVPKSGAYAAA